MAQKMTRKVKSNFEKALKLIAAAVASAKTPEARSRIEEITLTSDYAEPGYTAPESGVIAFGNWNSITKYNPATRNSDLLDSTPKDLAKALEKLGAACEWSDEWRCCDGCQKAVRVSADSYGWQRSYVETDGVVLCLDCIDPAQHLLDFEGQTKKCNTIHRISPPEWGYKKVEQEFENGLHEGQAASPDRIGAALREQGIERFLFDLDGVGQFDIQFSVWIHESEWDKFDPAKFAEAKTDLDLSPAEGLRRGLQGVSCESAPGGVVVNSIDVSTGKAETRVVSAQDFIEGKAFKK